MTNAAAAEGKVEEEAGVNAAKRKISRIDMRLWKALLDDVL
jgi:hypothetical protein